MFMKFIRNVALAFVFFFLIGIVFPFFWLLLPFMLLMIPFYPLFLCGANNGSKFCKTLIS